MLKYIPITFIDGTVIKTYYFSFGIIIYCLIYALIIICWSSFSFYKGKESVVSNPPSADTWYLVFTLLITLQLILGTFISSPGYPGLTFILMELGYGNIITTVLAALTTACQGYGAFLGIMTLLAFYNFNKARKGEGGEEDETTGETA